MNTCTKSASIPNKKRVVIALWATLVALSLLIALVVYDSFTAIGAPKGEALYIAGVGIAWLMLLCGRDIVAYQRRT